MFDGAWSTWLFGPPKYGILNVATIVMFLIGIGGFASGNIVLALLANVAVLFLLIVRWIVHAPPMEYS